ncbi:MAG: hypothetical protein MJE77_29195 [Proteobacteria bacterium]|nr:hypothetical protein [Pseudomonadota bacterium]
MTTTASHGMRKHRRILLVDDNPDIHRDFIKVLRLNEDDDELSAAAADLFDDIDGDDDDSNPPVALPVHEIDSAFQGQEALARVVAARAEGRPYAAAFVDMRMPPGWSGLRTIKEIWSVSPDLHIVICTAYTDHSWQDILDQLGATSRLLVVQKPFSSVEIQQAALALGDKYDLEKLINPGDDGTATDAGPDLPGAADVIMNHVAELLDNTSELPARAVEVANCIYRKAFALRGQLAALKTETGL